MTLDLWKNGALIEAGIWHGRSGDVAREFRYKATYLALPLGSFEAGELALRPDARGLWRLRRRDYGTGQDASLSAFVGDLLASVGLGNAEVTLITSPRSLGYGFNPVSFWLARQDGQLRAVLAEVSNTFGERHHYVCRHPDNSPIERTDRLTGKKLFHVSPFLPRQGQYVFRFDAGPGRFGAWVDWIGADGQVRLGTSMAGPARPLTPRSLRLAALRRPFQAQKNIGLIHWQAAKLFSRGVRYLTKPPQLDHTRSEASERWKKSDV